jgi:osmotically-inducible protein OsmY
MLYVTCGWLRWRILLACSFLLAQGAAFATEMTPDAGATLPSSTATTRDMQVLLRIRRALRTDDVLATHNVGVSVRDGVATLWGPLPSGDDIRRALTAVGDVRGVQSVRSELYVAKEPLPPSFILPETTTPDRAPSRNALASAGQPTILTKRDRWAALLPATDERPPLPSASATAVLLTPILPDAPVEQLTTVTAARTEGVSAAIERLQKADARFGQIDAEWRDGTIILHGKRRDAAAVMAFARLLSDVPGVERVVLQYAKRPEP